MSFEAWLPIRKVAILIVSYNSYTELLACLSAVSRLAHRDHAIFICENGSTDSFQKLDAHLADSCSSVSVDTNDPIVGTARETHYRTVGGQDIWLLHAATNVGYAGGVNICVRAADRYFRWDAIWILNPDTHPEENALSALVKRGTSQPFAVIGSRLLFETSARIQMYGGYWRAWIARGKAIGLGNDRDFNPSTTDVERQQQFVSGAAFFASKPFVAAAGPMDEQYFLYNEDLDWCFHRGSLPLLYEHHAIVLHAHGTSIGSSEHAQMRSPLAIYLEERNKLIFTRKHYPLRYPLVVLICFALCHQYLLRGTWRGYSTAVRGWLAGLCGGIGRPDEKLMRQVFRTSASVKADLGRSSVGRT
ncbi:MAG: glycosyltransferase family 2 protein [Alphaproteobacteria bacterium]|nr:MAG: glycosyltransferase family 2 protein [Alphaproteobacteria bacterium]